MLCFNKNRDSGEEFVPIEANPGTACMPAIGKGNRICNPGILIPINQCILAFFLLKPAPDQKTKNREKPPYPRG
jgi:hypothetical protein